MPNRGEVPRWDAFPVEFSYQLTGTGSRMARTSGVPFALGVGLRGLLESCAGTGPVGSIPPFIALSAFLNGDGARDVGKWESSLMKSPSSRRWSIKN
jgi:hypothetical protein